MDGCFSPKLGRSPLGVGGAGPGSVGGMRLIDVRAGRFEQAGVVVVLLGGFAFQQALAIPIGAVIAVLGAGLGARSPVRRLWTDVVGPRRPAPEQFEPESVIRLQSLIIGGGLTVATLVAVAGSVGLASVVAGVIAIVAALGATGLFTLAAEVQHRRGR